MISVSRVEQVIGLSVLTLIVLGCLIVMRPFISAVLWAGIICYATWPLHERVLKAMHGRRTLAAGITTMLVVVCMLLPFVIAGLSFADDFRLVVHYVADLHKNGLPPAPDWVAQVPLVGVSAHVAWDNWVQQAQGSVQALVPFYSKMRGWAFRRSLDIGEGVFQLTMSVIIVFFLYRDGVRLVDRLRAAVQRIAGDRAQHLVGVAGNTIKAVVYGLLGTALAQGVVAAIGFTVAGVPMPFLLGLLTFFLSLIPMGPPLVWIGATVWLLTQDHLGMAIFMGIYGLIGISGVDNLIRPLLISRGTNMPFVLTLLGVMGGIWAFGFIGVFIGPTLLAVGYALIADFISSARPGVPEAVAAQPT
ncbi:MAG: AI-2E family transporter [Kiritimatiellia bacterium]